MRIIAVIPARYEASRFPGKLLQFLGDRTVIATTYQNVVETNLFDDVFVATDSELIFNEIQFTGGKAVLTGSHETGSDRIAEAVQNLEADVIVNVQGDEPFLKLRPLQQLIKVFKTDEKKEISVASLKIKIVDEADIPNPNVVKVITDIHQNALYFSRSPVPHARETAVPTQYYRHIGVYAFRREALLKFARLPQQPLEIAEKVECLRYLEYGMKIRMVETDFVGVGIDVPEDLIKARKLL